jgi:hypothetical protein
MQWGIYLFKGWFVKTNILKVLLDQVIEQLGEINCCMEDKVASLQVKNLKAKGRDPGNLERVYNLKDTFLLSEFFRCFKL